MFLFSLPLIKKEILRHHLAVPRIQGDWYLSHMNCQPDKDKAADEVLNASRLFLKADESERVKGQLSYIVQDMKEEHQQNRSRGFHR